MVFPFSLSSHSIMLYHSILISIGLFRIPDAIGTVFTIFNATDKFAEYKAKHNKVYKNSDEEKNRYFTFINNLNAAAALNDTSKDGSTIYVMNKYADLDPPEVEERYAIRLKTFNVVENGDHKELLRSNHGIEINDDNLYNLKNSEDLFEKYIEEEKRNITKKREGFLHFYRFVKTLVEKNRGVFEANEAPELDHAADILKESQEYAY